MKPRKPISEETREKMRQAALNRSPEAEARRIAGLLVPESRAKLSEALKRRHAAGGREAEHFKKFQQKGHEASRKETLTYMGMHAWVRRNWGKADRCELCGKENLSGRKVHWANKDHQYSRHREDWMMLCRPCHARYDQENLGVSFSHGSKALSPEHKAAISASLRRHYDRLKST